MKILRRLLAALRRRWRHHCHHRANAAFIRRHARDEPFDDGRFDFLP